MKSFSNSKSSPVLLLTALIFALLFAVYYYVVLPKQDEVESMESSVNNLKMEMAALEESIAAVKEQRSNNETNEFDLRKKVPETRAIDELLLNIEEIEFVTGSRILKVEFNNYDSLVSDSGLQDPHVPSAEETEGQDATQTDTEANAETTPEEDTTPVSTIAADSLPGSLKLVTFNMEVASPNYKKLQQFIKEIENIERVMHIDTIQYELSGEENKFAEDKSDTVVATVQVTTFYYE
ncbi:potassium transporter [Lysinibacillus sp. 54212]|uniref:potassium transporter n=1 Tax=Lysinibacillus sp. 54212 TaxID=3119829 RepID=UPI002FCCB6CC